MDVHQALVLACIAVGPADRKPRTEVRRFGTVNRDLIALRAWLTAEGITHVAMESTGVYWMPIYAALEGDIELVVGNVHLKTALVTAAIGAAKRRGTMRAAVAIGHKILIAAYPMLATATGYRDLGAAFLDARHREHTATCLVRRLRDMGYDVTIQAKAA